MRHLIALWFFSLGCGLLPGFAMAEQPTRIEIIAPSFAPLQMNVDGEIKGYVVDLVKRVIVDVSKTQKIAATETRILPWRRAMSMALKNPNTLLFSLSRTSQREHKFLWVGEVSPYEIYFYKLARNKKITAKTVQDLKSRGFRVGVQVGSNTEELLETLGFAKGENYVTYSHFSAGIKMLFRNRFSALPLTSFVARANVCKQGFGGEQIAPVVRVDSLSKPLWMVFSKGTDAKLVTLFRKSLGKLKAAKIDAEIRHVYLENWHLKNCAGR